MISSLIALQVGASKFYEKAVVVSDHSLSSEVGAEIMRKGGNAIDAAVATGLSLAVTFPSAGNIGGGGFMVIRLKDGQSFTIDYREMAPSAASRNMYLDKNGKVTLDSAVGYRASGVPGTVAGFFAAHQKYGKLKWSQVVEPSIRQAKNGFALSYQQAKDFERIAKDNKQFPGTWRIMGRSGEFYKPGELFKQPELAQTLERIAKSGADGFYKGETAKLIEAEMENAGGIINQKDLATYKPEWRAPLTGSFQGYKVTTMPPPSSGGVIVLMMLGMIEQDDLKKTGFNSSATVHLLVETMKRCFADRARYMGDPGFYKVPVAELLDPQYLRKRRAEISSRTATPASQIIGGLPGRKESEQTTHYSVVDSEGNTVANTYTLNESYGSKVMLGSVGVLMNNEMDDFAAQPGTPNRYGLIQGEANAIAPGKRPLSSMTPTILEKDGKLFLVTGSPGGPTIINTVFEIILNSVVFNMEVQRAVNAPRFHHQWIPDQIRYEPFGFSNDVISQLKSMGHQFSAAQSQGSAHTIKLSPDGFRAVGIDPRISTSGASGF